MSELPPNHYLIINKIVNPIIVNYIPEKNEKLKPPVSLEEPQQIDESVLEPLFEGLFLSNEILDAENSANRKVIGKHYQLLYPKIQKLFFNPKFTRFLKQELPDLFSSQISQPKGFVMTTKEFSPETMGLAVNKFKIFLEQNPDLKPKVNQQSIDSINIASYRLEVFDRYQLNQQRKFENANILRKPQTLDVPKTPSETLNTLRQRNPTAKRAPNID